jgi:hypothetical protein
MIDSSLFSRCPEGSLVIDIAVFKPAFRSFVGNAMIESFASEIALIIEELTVGTSDWWPPFIEMVRVIDVFNANAVPNPIVGDAMREILRDLVDDVQANPAVIPAFV